jgi:hypothetical protein
MVPLLLRHAQDAVASAEGVDRRRALALLAVIYGATAALMSRVGETELAWIAADRAINTAQNADHSELVAVGLYRLAQAFLRAGRVDDAHRVATTAATSAGVSATASPAATSIHGALLLTAAIAAARHDDRRENLQLLRRAGDLASTLGQDRNDHHTAFGPTNVRIHATSSAVELGDPNEAIRQGERVDITRLHEGLLGRRSQVHIDLAWAYGQRRNVPATVLSLLEAERIAPEALRYNVTARELLRECLRRERRTAVPGLRGLAERTGIAG